jgi:c-di-GMP-binding flagellar brake protein YcgR
MMRLKHPERRKFIRASIPLRILVRDGSSVTEAVTKNISPAGISFYADKPVPADKKNEFLLFLPENDEPVSVYARTIWQRKASLEDNAPYDTGIEILKIREMDKNRFLKYLCDLLYNTDYEI